MDTEITATFCHCSDFLSSVGYQDDPQCKMNTAEVMTTALTATMFFSGDYERSRCFLKEYGYIPDMLSKSQFIHRLNRIPETVWRSFMEMIARAANNPLKTYLIDSFPVRVCRNIRIKNCKIYQGEEFRGYNASTREYFYGLKVHLMIAEDGIPVEMFLSHGSYSDTSSLYDFTFSVPEQSFIHGDKAYNVYDIEDELKELNIHLMPNRKKNSKRKYEPLLAESIKYVRKKIESTFSVIKQKLPSHIHAVTAHGFELKIILFVLAYSIQKAML